MSSEEEKYDEMVAECKRRGYDPDVLLRWARAFEAVRHLLIKKKKQIKRNENK